MDDPRNLLSEFFTKSMNVILAARVPNSHHKKKQSTSFGLLLFDQYVKNKSHWAVRDPVVLDVILTQQPDKKRMVPKRSLIERWIMQCADPRTSNNPWNTVKNMLVIMLRSLYSLTRLLPGYRLFQCLNANYCMDFDLSYDVTNALAGLPEEFTRFNLVPVDTQLGRVCISVKCAPDACVDQAVERRVSILPEIIPDYIGMHSRKPSNKTPLSGVRRTYSSPLQVKTDKKEVNCPFASEDERGNCQRWCAQGTSKNAAIGALVKELNQAAPIQRASPQMTLNDALEELRGCRANRARVLPGLRIMEMLSVAEIPTMEWELSKENVQPLRKGRKNVELLNQGLKAKIEAPAQSLLSEQRRILLEEIDNYTGNDPLKPWIRCIEWTKEAYPSGGTQSGLLPMLELCLRTFFDDAKYKDDFRYLKLWLEYSDRCTHPRDIYTFLEVNDIGQSYALFYISYAVYLEGCKNFAKANDVFQIGIARQVHPLDELKSKYRSFLERSARHAKQKQEEDDQDEGFVRSFGSVKTGPTAVRPLQKTTKHNIQPLSNQKFSVFVDSPTAKKTTGLENSASHSLPVWTNLGTQAERTKENIQHASKWNTAKIPHRASKPAPIEPPLNIYVDEEFSRREVSRDWEPRRKRTAALKLRLSRIQDLKADTEMLKQAPLRNFSRDLNGLR